MQSLSENSGHNAIPLPLPIRVGKLHEGVLHGIDLVAVAESHVLVFGRMRELVHGELPVTPALAALRRDCRLESWLKEEGAFYFSRLKSFGHLREVHDEFHVHMADVLDKVASGAWSAAEQVRKSELSRALHLLLLALIDFNHSVGK